MGNTLAIAEKALWYICKVHTSPDPANIRRRIYAVLHGYLVIRLSEHSSSAFMRFPAALISPVLPLFLLVVGCFSFCWIFFVPKK